MLCGGSGVGAKSQVGGAYGRWAEPAAGWSATTATNREQSRCAGGAITAWPGRAARC